MESQDLATTLREHVRAFEHLGGAAATCLYDNMKVVVDQWEDDQPIYNRRFLAFAMHYGFRPVACRPRRPQTKGKVERPIDRHAEERSSLLALPESAYEVHEVVYRVVDAEGFVACDGNRYLVPWKKTHPGEVLAVKITDIEVIIYGRDYCEIARHGLFLKTARGAVREDPAHGPPRETRLRRDVLQARFAEFGDVATQFLDGLWQAQLQAPSQAALILELSGLYRRPDFIAALSASRVPVSNEHLDQALQTAESHGDSHLTFLWELLGTARNGCGRPTGKCNRPPYPRSAFPESGLAGGL